jgi:hypothetical protein
MFWVLFGFFGVHSPTNENGGTPEMSGFVLLDLVTILVIGYSKKEVMCTLPHDYSLIPCTLPHKTVYTPPQMDVYTPTRF